MRLLADWQLDAVVVLVWPHEGMTAYRNCLADLQSFYRVLISELTRRERVLCVVPHHGDAERIAARTGLAPDAFAIGDVGDIWIRDFAPLPGDSGLVQFRYDPEYGASAHSRVVQHGLAQCLARLLRAGDARIALLPLVLEGGNVSHDGAGRVVACDKLLARNGFAGGSDALAAVRQAVEVDRLALIPVEPDDPIGHADGVARWLPGGQLVVNDYVGQPGRRYATYRRALAAALMSGFGPTEIVPIPYPLPRLGLDDPMNATGNYANFLVTRKALYLPAYGLREDEEVRSLLADLAGRPIVSIDATPLARQGGVLNCATWCCDASALRAP